jgi:hypothetical protein
MTETFMLAALEPKQSKQTLMLTKSGTQTKIDEEELQKDLSKKMLIIDFVPKMLF